MTTQSKVTSQCKSEERGIALLFCLFALLILTAITTSLILLSGTETAVNANYRSEEVSFFAAKAGIYEALDRMQSTNAHIIAAPTTIPTAAGGVLYIINAGSSLTVHPWDSTNAYFDDEFCHEGYSITGMTATSPGVPCTTVPTGTTWYSTVTSNYPWSGTSTAIPYEWVRVNWKENSSESYISGGPSAPVTSKYSVNSGQTATTPACWNGASEILLSTPAGVSPAYTSCLNYQSCGGVVPAVSSPVMMITALAITSNGSRQMVQTEAAINPPILPATPACGITDAYGFFAYGTSCSPPSFDIGGNAFVDGYNSANGGTYASTHAASKGSIGSNGGVYAHGTSTNVGGNVYVESLGLPTATPPYSGSCPGVDFSVAGSPLIGHVLQSQPVTKPTVTIPASGATNKTAGHGQNLVVAPGSYGTLSVGSGGQITLTAPGTYNVGCIVASSAGSNITISPATAKVTINVSGTGCALAPINFGSNTLINNSSGVASNLQINYAGTGTLTFTGGTSDYLVVNAPNAAVVLHGGADLYGTIMANTIDDSGGTNLHFDQADGNIGGVTATTVTATATGPYTSLSFKSLPY
jgi:hypothetical protein